MIDKILRFILSAAGLILGYVLVSLVDDSKLINLPDGKILTVVIYLGVSFIFGIILFILAPKIIKAIKKLVQKLELELQKIPMTQVVIGTLGLIVGLLIAYLASQPFYKIEMPFLGVIISVLIYIVLGYLGMKFPVTKSEEIMKAISSLKKETKDKDQKKNKGSIYPKVLDTSVIIDGRIADICKTGFIEGPLVIPEFVLGELQSIADSSDGLKRNRGRRGLDILNKIQKELDIEVIIHEEKFPDVPEVDTKLLKLTQLLEGRIITNDYNLNKVAEVQGIEVLNINDLANAVKPVVLPGEEMEVQIIKSGKEAGQGLAYLDDGTMIVVESGRAYIGNTIGVLVTSVLQTSAGRMIFAKPNIN